MQVMEQLLFQFYLENGQNDIELIHDKIKKYEFKWAKQNYEDQKLKEAQELLRSKRIMENAFVLQPQVMVTVYN